MAGPLDGLRVVEMVGIEPAPFAAMLVADMGAEVIRVDRLNAGGKDARGTRLEPRFDVLARGRRSLAIDLEKPGAAEVVLELAAQADALIEGFRPGVMERMGLSPREPPAAESRSGVRTHDRVGAERSTGPRGGARHQLHRPHRRSTRDGLLVRGPVPPLNLVGDFGGGGMLMAFGVMCALSETRRSGKGQVVDVAMTDGTALLSSSIYGLKAAGDWSSERGENFLDGAAHFCGTYAWADGEFISIGSIEPQFYALLLELCGIADPVFDAQLDKHSWPMLKKRLADVFRTKTRQ